MGVGGWGWVEGRSYFLNQDSNPLLLAPEPHVLTTRLRYVCAVEKGSVSVAAKTDDLKKKKKVVKMPACWCCICSVFVAVNKLYGRPSVDFNAGSVF